MFSSLPAACFGIEMGASCRDLSASMMASSLASSSAVKMARYMPKYEFSGSREDPNHSSGGLPEPRFLPDTPPPPPLPSSPSSDGPVCFAASVACFFSSATRVLSFLVLFSSSSSSSSDSDDSEPDKLSSRLPRSVSNSATQTKKTPQNNNFKL